MARSTSFLFVALGPEVATLPFVEMMKSGSRRAGAARKVPGWVRCLGVVLEAPGVWWKLG